MPEKTPRGLADVSGEPRFLIIGRVVKPHGVRGEVRVEVHTDLPERFSWLDTVYLGRKDPQPVTVEGVRYHKSWVLLKISGIDDRFAAEELRSQWLQIPREQALPLEEGQYYLYQVLDVGVYLEDGKHLGKVIEVMETKANNVFVVAGQYGEVLLPDIDDVILEIDIDNKRMTVRLLPGLLDSDH
ncbi:MAG TPA: ribosome maturation factor RimM [Patescibacteria group bacterium]|nr:ribosome maturation factor RimM [Patescibacteria group bacterium]